MTIEQISDNPIVQARYEAMVAAGESPRLAEMLAFRKAPASHDDTQWLKNRTGPFGVETPITNKLLKQRGAPQGVYISRLARFPADPKAVFSSRDDVYRACRERNIPVEGKVKQDNSLMEPPKEIAIADDIVERRLRTEAAKDPGLVSTPKKREKAKADIRDKIKPHWAKD